MPDYEKLYHKMFNGITDTIINLINLQQEVEEDYLNSCEEDSKRRTKMKLVKKSETEQKTPQD